MEKKKTNLWKEAGQLLLIMLLNCFILFVVTSLEGCSILSEEEIEEIRKDAYDDAYKEGYKAAEFENRSTWEKEAFSEGYSAALKDYDVEESVHIECPHCGINISADHDGYVNDWWW